MKFLNKHIATMTTVPDDVVERRQAIERSRKKLQETMDRVPRMNKMVGDLRYQTSVNHYAERLRYAYGVRSPHVRDTQPDSRPDTSVGITAT